MSGPKIISKKIIANNRHWKNFVDKDYLGAHNLEPGEELLLTISRFEGAELVKSTEHPKGQPKLVLYFKEDVPKMILNMTNGNMLSQLYGTHPDGWIGKQIQVYAARVKAFGKEQDALRIRDFVPKIAVDVAGISQRLSAAQTLDDLKAVWSSLPVSAQSNPDLIQKKDELKLALTQAAQ